MAKKVIKKPSIQDILNGGKSLSNDISNYNRYEPNISTQVNNVVKKKYNTNRDKLEEHKTKIGGYYANTTRGKIGTALSAVPFAVAAIPALGASGEAAAPYLAKAAASTAIKPILTTLKNPWVDATLTSMLGAEPLSESYDNIKKGKFGVEDAINTLPVTAPLVGKGAQMLYKFKNKWIPKDYNNYLNERDFNTKVLYRNQDEFKKASDEIRSINKEINKTQPALSNVRKTIDDRDLVWKSYIKKQKEAEPTYILRHKYLDKEIQNRLANDEIKHNDNIDTVFGNYYNLYNNRNGTIANDLADFVDDNPDKFYYNTIKDFSKIPESKLSDLTRKYGISLPYDRVNNRFNLTAAESPYTTGNISVPNFKTGKTETFYIPERFGKSTKYISGKYPFEIGTVVGDPKIKHLPPQEYTRLTKDNIDEIIKNYLTEAKPFGSSVLVSEGKINHGTHDYDFIMSLNDAKNHPDFNKWYPKRYDKSNRVITYGYEHPKYGELDINVIHENDGKAFGSLANELSIEQNPKLYADWRKKDLINNKESDVVPQSAKELLTNMNPSDKTLLDMMFSGKNKHVDRLYDRLNYEDVDEVSKQIDNYYNVVLGGKYKKPNIPLSEFTDPEKNAKMLQGLKGINVDKVKYEPERVKMLVEYMAGDKFFNGRGVDPRTDNTLLNSMNKWMAETHGGTANGVGLNTVVGGDSGYGNVYASIIPKGSKSYDDVKTLDDLRNVINHNTGNIKLSNEDRNFINKAIKEANEERLKQGLKPIQLDDDNNFNLADVLEATEYQKGEPLKKLLNKIYERFNVPAIANKEFGYKGQYASLTTDQDIDNIAQLFSHDIDRPKSILNRGYNLSTVNSNEVENTQRRIKEISKRSAYGKTKERIDDVVLMKHINDPDAYFDAVIETNRNMVKNKHKQQIIKEFNEKLQKDKIRYKNIGDILDYLKDTHYVKDRNAYGKIYELEDKLVHLNNERRYQTETFNSAKRNIRDTKDKLKDNPYYQLIRNSYYKYHDKLKSQDNKLNNFKNLININNMINSKKDRKKYAGGGKVPPAAAPVRLQINPTNLPLPFTSNKAPMTNGEFKVEMARQRGRKMVSDYKDWLNHVDKRTFDAVMKMKNTTEPTVPYIKINTPEQREALESAYNYAKEINSPDLPAWEYGMRTNSLPGATCINTITDKYGRPIASNVDLAKNYKKYGYKKVNMKEMEPGDIVQLSMNDTPFHAMMATSTFDPIYKTFSVDQSHGGYDSRTIEHNKKFTTDRDQLDIRSGKIKNDIRALDKSYHYINDNGIQLYRKVWNTPEYRNGGKVTANNKNNYILKGSGTYVPKTPQEKVVVDLYNANYKSARKNMSREDALRQAHYRTTQQALESGYGTSRQAKHQNNYGGMGGGKGFKYKTLVDFTNHVDSTLQSNFNKSYNAPTLNYYINGLYEGRIGNYSETPKDEYGKLLRGTHGRTSRVIEQLNPDDYTLLNNMYNPYGNTNLMYAKYGCKVRPKAWIGAAISAVAGIASSLINANAQKKAAARQARAQEAAENRKYATDLTTQLNNSSADDTQFYDQFKTEFKNGGKVKGYNARITDGGIAIPIGHNTSLLRGSLHNEINEAGNTGIGIKYGNNEVEAQDGEVVRKKKDKLLVYSNEDELGNGISPAKRVLRGENKDKVFAIQENNKRRKGIVNNNKTFLTGGHMTFTKGDAYGAAANAVGNIASFFINNNAINKMSAGKAPILVSPTKLNTVYNANAQLADINKSRLRMKNAITRNSSSSVAALGRLNDIENSAIDKVNQIYENKNNVESQLMNQDRMNAQSVRLQNASKMDEYNRRVAEIDNQKHLAKAQNVTSLINGLAGAAEQTINNAEERYYKDKNLEIAAAPYDDETTSKLLEIKGAVPENRIVEIYLRNKDSQDPKKKALAELAFRRMNNFDSSSKYNSYINQEYRNKAKLIGNNGYKVPTLGNINTNIRLNGETPYYINPLIARTLNRNNDFISYMNGYRY